MRRIGVLALVCCPARSCPDDWTASKFGCHRIVRAPIGQYDCPALCGHNATLACIGSTEESAFVKDLAATTAVTWLWLGHYQREEAAGGWDSCASGEASNFSNWPDNPSHGQTSSMAMYSSSSCVAMVLSHGQWIDRPCPGPLSSIGDTLSCGGCLCEHGAEGSPEFTAFVDAERRRFQDYMAPRNLFTGIWFGIALPLLSALPVLIPWCRSRGRARRARRTVQESSPNAQSEETEPSNLSANTLLAEAELASVQLRHRVSGTIALVGWVLCLVGWSPFVLVFLGNPLAAAGPFPCMLGSAFLGTPTLVLALRPTDAARVANACRFFFGLNVLLVCVAFVATLNSLDSASSRGIASSSIFVALCVAIAAFLAPAAFSCRSGRCCVADSSMPPRRQLRRLWVAVRCWLIFTAIILLWDIPLVEPCQLEGPNSLGFTVAAVCALFASVSLTPANRGRVHRWLGSLGSNASKQQEAAAVAALLGGSGRTAASALHLAEQSFRALPVSSLSVEDLVDNTPSPQLFGKTRPAALRKDAHPGEVSAFVSHSWSDPGALKYGHLQEFAAAHDGGDCLLWLDKACIDQTNIDTNLACLPVFLSGCNSLLVLAGPTYATRLWCVMELFVYLRMGGQREDVTVRLLGATEAVRELLVRFDAGKARCYLGKDREKLLAVIEAGFGTFTPFNSIVRGIFAEKVQG